MAMAEALLAVDLGEQRGRVRESSSLECWAGVRRLGRHRRRSDVVEQATVEEGLDGVDGSGVVLVFPSLNEGD